MASSAMASTPQKPQPPPRPPLRQLLAPIFLFTTVVSLAFNRARLARDRSEEHRRHLVAYHLLDDELRRLTRGRGMMTTPLEDEKAFASRCARAGIDLRRLGIRKEALPAGYLDRDQAAMASSSASTAGVTWAQALFGGQGTTERLKEAVSRAATSLKASFAGAAGGGAAVGGQGKGEVSEQQQDEWEQGERSRQEAQSLLESQVADLSLSTALLAYAASAERAEEAEKRRREEQQQRQATLHDTQPRSSHSTFSASHSTSSSPAMIPSDTPLSGDNQGAPRPPPTSAGQTGGRRFFV